MEEEAGGGGLSIHKCYTVFAFSPFPFSIWYAYAILTRKVEKAKKQTNKKIKKIKERYDTFI